MNTSTLPTIVDAGLLVFLAGQVAFDDQGIVRGDTAAQTRLCLECMEHALRETGLSSSQLVECTIWLCHQADVAAFDDTYAAYFGSRKPACTILIGRLTVAGALVEIDAVARRAAGGMDLESLTHCPYMQATARRSRDAELEQRTTA
ncbi:RidA family protein [Rhodanobacter glycinis]|uniref:RidA family protein n=1 Tax=Rhodanobacter glycinis TaxID=582702 RepID=A0A5B9DZC7_9GAMM|nr:RidA family protein [Rhodanobacter glycinis]QEE24938.1 RidA family protein [Rhodanobacter glycinis]